MDKGDWWAIVHSKQLDITEVTYHVCTRRIYKIYANFIHICDMQIHE